MVLKILTTSHSPNAAATNATNLTRRSSAPYAGDSRITNESSPPTAIAANPALQPTHMHTAATATSRPEGSFARNASKMLAPLIATATVRRQRQSRQDDMPQGIETDLGPAEQDSIDEIEAGRAGQVLTAKASGSR